MRKKFLRMRSTPYYPLKYCRATQFKRYAITSVNDIASKKYSVDARLMRPFVYAALHRCFLKYHHYTVMQIQTWTEVYLGRKNKLLTPQLYLPLNHTGKQLMEVCNGMGRREAVSLQQLSAEDRVRLLYEVCKLTIKAKGSLRSVVLFL